MFVPYNLKTFVSFPIWPDTRDNLAELLLFPSPTLKMFLDLPLPPSLSPVSGGLILECSLQLYALFSRCCVLLILLIGCTCATNKKKNVVKDLLFLHNMGMSKISSFLLQFNLRLF